MPIEAHAGGVTVTGSAIDLFQLCALRGALKLEALGMKRRGRSALSCAKAQGFTGTRAQVLAQVQGEIDRLKAAGV